MIDRLCQIGLIAAVALFFSLAIFNNLTDYATNFAFVQHVLSMDTIFPDSPLKWRAIANPGIQQAFYWTIIAWEMLTAVLCWMGVSQLCRHLSADTPQFSWAKTWGIMGLTASCLLWLVAFLGVGGEWFAMWQSEIWNGQPIAFRMFTISSLVLLFVRQSDPGNGKGQA